MLIVSYFSAGVSSAVATKLAIDQIDRIFYTHIDDQHPDTMRFVTECEGWFGKPVEIWQSPYFKTVDEVCRYRKFLKNRNSGAPCTEKLKRDVRKQFEYDQKGNLRIVWGMDYTEKDRAEKIRRYMPEHEHLFPLIDQKITKEQAHEIMTASGIKRPAMYDLGYHNNNCIGCIKGGMGYWNKIRVDFPDVFAARARLERYIGYSITQGVFLDELRPEQGRHDPPITGDCGILCEIMAL
jgi:hypothetical protein